MKTIRIFSIMSLFMAIAVLSLPKDSFAQKVTTGTFNVSGECGMCKKKIEKAAKDAGATYALWDQQTKVLKVTYNVNAASVSSIQQKIAAVGYDTQDYRATDEAYNSLDQCCQYPREQKQQQQTCCGSRCEKKDGKCINEAACKENGCCTGSGVCKDMSCCKKTQ